MLIANITFESPGKSYLAKAVATEADSTFFSVSSSDLVSKWQGESERLVKNLFEMAREAEGRSIIFIDEVDSLCSSRTEGESDSGRRIKTEFLVQMDGVGKNKSDILVLGATNVPWELDSAIRRRFEKRIYIPLPEKEARSYMLKLHIGDTLNDLTDDDFDALGSMTEGASGSDISVLVRDALMQPLRKCQQAKQFMPVEGGKFLIPAYKYPSCPYCPPKLSSDKKGKDYTCARCGAIRMTLWEVDGEKLKVPDLCVTDFEAALKHAVSSVSSEELLRFVEWTNQFGQEGS
jgi:vacuolar protein-sorting-associated protein 4